MGYWKQSGNNVVGDFRPQRCRQLYYHVEWFRVMLTDAELWQRTSRSNHLDQFWSGRYVEAYRRAVAVVSWHERIPAFDTDAFGKTQDHLQLMIGYANEVLAALRMRPEKPILVDSAHLDAWLWTLYGCAMDIALQAGIPWGAERVADIADIDKKATADHRIVSWLLEVVDALLDVAEFPVLPEEAGPVP